MRVSNIILRVSDLAASVAFYRDQMGLELASQSGAFAFFDGESISIALNVNPDQPHDETLTEIVLEVDDLDATYREMAGRGIHFEVEPRAVMEQGGRALHAAHFHDPDGHTWSITGWV
jgi:lactoylglutathione lyase